MTEPADRAADIARTLSERPGLSAADALGAALPEAIDAQWPGLTPSEIGRAVAIFLELRLADDAFARYGQQPRFGEPPQR